MWSLQYFVNNKYKIIPKIKTLNKYIKLSMEDKLKVRKVLFQNKNIFKEFIQLNPNNFSQDLLDIILSWENFIEDSFFIERYLKKYTVFIRENDVYGVLGLYEGFEDMIPYTYLPTKINAILLPFKGKIIFDGIFFLSNIFFGHNIQTELKDTYILAKNQNQIITCI